MKKVKKTLAMLICLALMCMSVSAQGTPTENLLTPLAEAYITITETSSSNATTEIVYSGLQEFYSTVHELYPFVSDLELAQFTMTYTGLDEYELNSEEQILEMLDFYSVTTNTEYVAISEDGECRAVSQEEMISPLATWNSSDGYMKIDTTAADKGKNPQGYKQYVITAKATWLKFTLFRLTDTFAITYGGVFDDSHIVSSTFTHNGKCSICGKTVTHFCQEEYNSAGGNVNDPGIELDFAQANAVGVKFDLQELSCIHSVDGNLVNGLVDKTMYTTLQARILVPSLTEVRAAYAHKTIGISDISISGNISGDGVAPSFNIGIGITASKYSAAPVTLYP